MTGNILYNIQVSTEGLCNIEYAAANGKKVKKLTDLEALVAMFSSIKNTSETPLLPFGCRKIVTTEKNDLIMIETPQKVVPEIKYGNQSFKDVMIPRALWVFYVKKQNDGKRQLYKTNIYALDSLSPFSMNIPMYEWFLNNHSFGYYGVCWGNNNIQRIVDGDYANFTSLTSVYLSSVFNDHLPPASTRLTDFFNLLSDADKKGCPPSGMPGFLYVLQRVKMLPDRVLKKRNETPQSIIHDFLSGRGNT